jgi:hypothetical protein
MIYDFSKTLIIDGVTILEENKEVTLGAACKYSCWEARKLGEKDLSHVELFNFYELGNKVGRNEETELTPEEVVKIKDAVAQKHRNPILGVVWSFLNNPEQKGNNNE